MSIFDKIKIKLAIVFHSFFYAMKAGDSALFQTSNGSSDSEINHQVSHGGVMQDLLNQEETQQVKEIRDEYYRILNEADKFHVDVSISVNDSGEVTGDISATARKKTAADFSQHCNVYEESGTTLRVIQDNNHIAKDTENALKSFSMKNGVSVWDYDTTLDLYWGDIIPRFRFNKFVSKIVVRNINNTEAIIDLYMPTIAGQFTKLDAIFIAELNRLFKDKTIKSDLKNLLGLNFITDKAWNSDNLCLFEYDSLSFHDLIVYDGNFVISYKGRIAKEGESVTEKFRTKELDEKYATNAPKGNATDIFAIDRHINGINFGSTTLKITNEQNNK